MNEHKQGQDTGEQANGLWPGSRTSDTFGSCAMAVFNHINLHLQKTKTTIGLNCNVVQFPTVLEHKAKVKIGEHFINLASHRPVFKSIYALKGYDETLRSTVAEELIPHCLLTYFALCPAEKSLL